MKNDLKPYTVTVTVYPPPPQPPPRVEIEIKIPDELNETGYFQFTGALEGITELRDRCNAAITEAIEALQ